MYKYVSSDIASDGFLPKSFYINRGILVEQNEEVERIDKFRHRYCNNIANLVHADEGGFIEGWTLQGEFCENISLMPFNFSLIKTLL